MKTSAIVCATLVAALGFGNAAFARDWDHGQRQVQLDPRDNRADVIRSYGFDPALHPGRTFDSRDNRADVRRSYSQPRYVYQQPARVYQQPGYAYRAQAPRFYRGGYLPHAYRNRGYYVNNWNAYPALYAPPYGYQWMNVDGNFLLVALATGLIANALID